MNHGFDCLMFMRQIFPSLGMNSLNKVTPIRAADRDSVTGLGYDRPLIPLLACHASLARPGRVENEHARFAILHFHGYLPYALGALLV